MVKETLTSFTAGTFSIEVSRAEGRIIIISTWDITRVGYGWVDYCFNQSNSGRQILIKDQGEPSLRLTARKGEKEINVELDKDNFTVTK